MSELNKQSKSRLLRKVLIPHGHTIGARSPTYESWSAMKSRCYNRNDTSYQNYGGRGIKVYRLWHKFPAFLADMGNRPEGMTLDRLLVDGNYEPGNTRWATPKEQRNNRRDSRT